MELRSLSCIQCKKQILLSQATDNEDLAKCRSCGAIYRQNELTSSRSNEMTDDVQNQQHSVQIKRDNDNLSLVIKERYRPRTKLLIILFALFFWIILIIPLHLLGKIIIGFSLALSYAFARSRLYKKYRITIGPLYLTSFRSSLSGHTYSETNRVKTDDIRNITIEIKSHSKVYSHPEFEVVAQTDLQKIVIVSSFYSAPQLETLAEAIKSEIRI